MSLFTRIWQRIRRPISFRGIDLEGNSFHEYPSTTDDPRRTRRIIRYRRQKQLWEYATNGQHMPAQWKSWLTHTRPDPPSLEELHADVFRQQRLMQNVARIQARDREEQLRLAQSAQEDRGNLLSSAEVRSSASNSAAESQADARQKDPLTHPVPEVEGSSSLSPPYVPPTRRAEPLNTGTQSNYSDETQSWVPKTMRRGGR